MPLKNPHPYAYRPEISNLTGESRRFIQASASYGPVLNRASWKRVYTASCIPQSIDRPIGLAADDGFILSSVSCFLRIRKACHSINPSIRSEHEGHSFRSSDLSHRRSPQSNRARTTHPGSGAHFRFRRILTPGIKTLRCANVGLINRISPSSRLNRSPEANIRSGDPLECFRCAAASSAMIQAAKPGIHGARRIREYFVSHGVC